MRYVFVLIFIALPWLNPFALGPAPAIFGVIVTWTCAVAVWGMTAYFTTPTSDQRFGISIAMSWALAASLSSVIGLVQYFGATNALQPWMSGASADIGEAYANLRQRNQFATLTSMGLAAVAWGLAPTKTPMRWATWFAAALLGVGNAASSSRTGLLQLICLVLVSMVWGQATKGRPAAGRRVLWWAVAAYVVAAMVLPFLANLDPSHSGIVGRLHDGPPVCTSRLTLWSNVLQLIAQKPWLGWGWGELDYAHFITLYPGERFCDILDNAHNLPLHLAVELGVPFALALCSVCAWLVLRAKPWHEVDPTRQMAWAVLALIGLHSMLEYPLWYGPFQLAVALSVFLLVRTPTTEATFPRGPLAAAAAIAMCTCAYVGCDYWRISQIYLVPAERAAAYREDTLTKIQGSILFKNQVRFAELGTTQLTPGNAQHIFELATDLLHFSPEPSVVKKVIESAVMLGRDAEAAYYLQRFKAAFPSEHATWLKGPP